MHTQTCTDVNAQAGRDPHGHVGVHEREYIHGLASGLVQPIFQFGMDEIAAKRGAVCELLSLAQCLFLSSPLGPRARHPFGAQWSF